jgi:hypothetical protein
MKRPVGITERNTGADIFNGLILSIPPLTPKPHTLMHLYTVPEPHSDLNPSSRSNLTPLTQPWYFGVTPIPNPVARLAHKFFCWFPREDAGGHVECTYFQSEVQITVLRTLGLSNRFG